MTMPVFVFPTPRFKTVLVKLFLHVPIEHKPTENALLPYVLRRGTATYPTTLALTRRLYELYGAELQTAVRKIGDYQTLEFALEFPADPYLPKGHSVIHDAFQILGEILMKPRLEGESFPADTVSQEKETLRKEIEGVINDKIKYSLERCVAEMFKDEPFGIFPLGRLADLPYINGRGLCEHYRRTVGRHQADLYVIGHVREEEVQELAREHLGPLFAEPWKPLFIAPSAKSTQQVSEVVEHQDVNQGKLVMGYRSGIGYGDEEYFAYLMYLGLLGAFPHSKLFANVREKENLAYFAYTRPLRTKGVFLAYAGIDFAKYEKTRCLIEQQVADMAEGKFGEELMDLTRKAYANELLSLADHPARYLNSRMEGARAGRREEPAEIVEKLNNVTREQIIEVAKRVHLDTVYFLTGKEVRR